MDDPTFEPVTRHRFFKGCTRPATFWGVPLVPFLLVTGGFLLLAMWSFYLLSPYISLVLAMIYAPIILVMRQITKKDDQRLRQVVMRARMRFRHANRDRWGATSYAPLRYRKQSS